MKILKKIDNFWMILFGVLGVLLVICCISAIVASPFLWICVILISIGIIAALYYYFQYSKVGSLLKHGAGHGYDSTEYISTESSL